MGARAIVALRKRARAIRESTAEDNAKRRLHNRSRRNATEKNLYETKNSISKIDKKVKKK